MQETAPTRANKAKGIKSQKQLREEEFDKFNKNVKALAHK